jgi:hypothetical protein
VKWPEATTPILKSSIEAPDFFEHYGKKVAGVKTELPGSIGNGLQDAYGLKRVVPSSKLNASNKPYVV